MTISDIEKLSFEILAQEYDLSALPELQAEVVARIVHASADPSFIGNTVFSDNFFDKFKQLLTLRPVVITDVRSVSVAITQSDSICALDEPYEILKDKTKSYSSMYSAAHRHGTNNALYVIGCSPTSLFAVLDIAKQWETLPLVVAMPVGFVDAAESKNQLIKTNIPCLTNIGKKGGSAVTAAAVNALFYTARGERRLKRR